MKEFVRLTLVATLFCLPFLQGGCLKSSKSSVFGTENTVHSSYETPFALRPYERAVNESARDIPVAYDVDVVVTAVPTKAITVGPVETWKAEKVSIWHAGTHDNPFGMRLTTLMISKKIADSSVPMSLLAGHPDVQFNFYRPAIGKCEAEMH